MIAIPLLRKLLLKNFGGIEKLDNDIHPNRPSNSKDWECPICDIFDKFQMYQCNFCEKNVEKLAKSHIFL